VAMIRIVAVTKLLFPLCTMAGMSFFSFAYNLADLAGRCSFLATLFLASVSMIFVIGETVSPTRLDGAEGHRRDAD
jgi:hypothetical protein